MVVPTRYASSATDAVRLAREDRGTLVPILGAGTSISLGLPTWDELVERLEPSTGRSPGIETPARALSRLKQTLGTPLFIAKIRDLLRLPGPITSATLQALVSAPVRRILTTNLDYAIETAFAEAGFPLASQDVGRGHALDELALFESAAERVLLKLHGSLERPDTWVLTQEDYDRAYRRPGGSLHDFLVAKISTPLFIGFGFSDADVNDSLRVAGLQWRRQAYAIVPANLAEAKQAEFAANSIIPIPFWSFDQIPEIIDEIFGCAPLRVEWTHRPGRAEAVLRVGATTVETNGKTIEPETVLSDAGIRAVTNALEIQPNQSVIGNVPRRQHGAKGLYHTLLFQLLKEQDAGAIRLFFRAAANYRDVLLEGVFPSLLRRSDLDGDDWFWLLSVLYDSLDGTWALVEANRFLAEALHSQEHQFAARRTIAKVFALRGLHPALFVPPPSVQVGMLEVSIYPLTQSQVATLRGQHLPNNSVRPYILQSLQEVEEILGRLRMLTARQWRLPSESEWLSFAGLGDGKPWPWGNEPPSYREHAHLLFEGIAGRDPGGAIEVGLFPRGRSSTGLYDLIGNVHEVVLADDVPGGHKLAGGAWTSKYDTGWRFRTLTGLHHPRPNAGIRPVVDVIT
jgi:hypothetical protein